MARWLIQKNDTQSSVASLAELKQEARQGNLGAGDMVQPPGTTEWLYAAEIDELKEDLAAGAALDAELASMGKQGGAGSWALALVLTAVVAGGGYYLYETSQNLPDPTARIIDQISYSEVVVTQEGAAFLSEPEGGRPMSAMSGGTVLELLAKRGDLYRARDKKTGQEGWVATDAVLPMYRMGGKEVIEQYDPLYNPDRYLEVRGASWMQLPEQRETSLTVFQFGLRNASRYDMTDVKIVATIKDEKGHELETVEFPIEGLFPAEGTSMVGTLVDPESDDKRLITRFSFDKMAEADPDLRLQYSDGVEVEMQTMDFQEASIDIAELRAVPGEDAPSAG